VSIARWNLKEAAGKALARRTEIAYEAGKLDEKAHIFKVRYLYGKLGCRGGGHKREGESALPGEICNFANEATIVARRWDEVAEVSRGHSRLIRPDRRPEHEVTNQRLEFR
jgi:hypothetical protein